MYLSTFFVYYLHEIEISYYKITIISILCEYQIYLYELIIYYFIKQFSRIHINSIYKAKLYTAYYTELVFRTQETHTLFMSVIKNKNVRRQFREFGYALYYVAQ